MNKKITLSIMILIIIAACTPSNNGEDSATINNQLHEKNKAYIVIESRSDTLYYEDLSKKDFYSSEENVALIRDIFNDPESYGLHNDSKYNDENLYINTTGFIVRKGDKDLKINSSKFNSSVGATGIYEINGYLTICDASMNYVTSDYILNDCPNDAEVIGIARRKPDESGQLANFSFMSAGDKLYVTDGDYYYVSRATIFTQSHGWVEMFDRAMSVDAVGCIEKIK